MLRALWKLSFIKIDDEENQALIDIILKRNEEFIFNGGNSFEYNNVLQKSIVLKLNEKYYMKSDKILSFVADGQVLKHEMAIEAALCEKLIKNNTMLVRVY